MKRYERELTAEELAALPDEDIDYSDIPELDEEWFRTARLVMPDEETKERITIRLSREVTDYFRKQGKPYPDKERRKRLEPLGRSWGEGGRANREEGKTSRQSREKSKNQHEPVGRPERSTGTRPRKICCLSAASFKFSSGPKRP